MSLFVFSSRDPIRRAALQRRAPHPHSLLPRAGETDARYLSPLSCLIQIVLSFIPVAGVPGACQRDENTYNLASSLAPDGGYTHSPIFFLLLGPCSSFRPIIFSVQNTLFPFFCAFLPDRSIVTQALSSVSVVISSLALRLYRPPPAARKAARARAAAASKTDAGRAASEANDMAVRASLLLSPRSGRRALRTRASGEFVRPHRSTLGRFSIAQRCPALFLLLILGARTAVRGFHDGLARGSMPPRIRGLIFLFFRS